MTMRLIFAFAGFVGVFLAPWWATILCILALSVLCRSWEALALGLLFDLLWLPAGFPVPVFTALALIIVWGLEPLRLLILRN